MNQLFTKFTLISFITSALVVVPYHSESRAIACQIYGEVLSSMDARYQPGKQLCEGQVFTPVASVLVSCWNQNQALWINTPKDLERCKELKVPQRRCTNDVKLGCVIFRGRDKNIPSLLSPFGETFLSKIPVFEWLSVPDSEYYMLSVLGQYQRWKIKTKNTYITWPKNEFFMPGQTYQVIVQAFKGEEILSSSSSALNILSKKEQLDLEKYLSVALRRKNTDSQAKTVVALLNTYNLKGEAKFYLEKSIKISNNNIVLKKLLYELYMEAGLPVRNVSQKIYLGKI